MLMLYDTTSTQTIRHLSEAGLDIVEYISPNSVVMRDADGNYSRWIEITENGYLVGYQYIGEAEDDYQPNDGLSDNC